MSHVPAEAASHGQRPPAVSRPFSNLPPVSVAASAAASTVLPLPPPLFHHLPPPQPTAAAAVDLGPCADFAALLGSLPSLSTAAGTAAPLQTTLQLPTGALDFALDMYPSSSLLNPGLNPNLARNPTHASRLLGGLNLHSFGLDTHPHTAGVAGPSHGGLWNPTTASLLIQEASTTYHPSALMLQGVSGGTAGHSLLDLQLPSQRAAAAAALMGPNPYTQHHPHPIVLHGAAAASAAAGSSLGSNSGLAELLQDHNLAHPSRPMLTHGRITTATGGLAQPTAAVGSIPSGSSLPQMRLQGGPDPHWVPQQHQLQQQLQGLQLPGTAAAGSYSNLLQQTLQARGGSHASLQSLLQGSGQQQAGSTHQHQLALPDFDANWIVNQQGHQQQQQSMYQHQLQQLQLQLPQPRSLEARHMLQTGQPPLPSDLPPPPSPAPQTAAAAANPGSGAAAREHGPYISLHDNGAGPNGLFGVNKERAEAAVPLEAAGPDAKRDRAATARRALAQKGGKPTSTHRGVTHHVRTGRWEAHIWLEGKQVYLGGFDSEAEAAMAYDLAAVKFRGRAAQTNFSLTNYEAELAAMNQVRGDDLVAALRRQSRGPASTSSSFRGVTRHAKGRWEARIGRGAAGKNNTGGRKYTYLGLYDTEIEAAMAYDRAAVKQKGLQAITNFDLAQYLDELNPEELQHYMQNCPPEAVAAAAAATAAAQQQQQEAAAAQVVAAAAEQEEQQVLVRTTSRRGVAMRRAAAAAAAAWVREPDGLEDDAVMTEADQQNNVQRAAQEGGDLAQQQQQQQQLLLPPSHPAAAAATGSGRSSPAAAIGSGGRPQRATRGRRGRQSTPADVASPRPRKGRAAQQQQQDVEDELRQEQRQYSQYLLDTQQQQQQEELQQQKLQKRTRRTSRAAANPAASPFARSASFDAKAVKAANGMAKVQSAAPRASSDPSQSAAGRFAAGSSDLPPVAPLRRTVTAPPMSAQFLTDLSLDLHPREQADVNDFVMPDDDQEGPAAATSGDAAAAGPGAMGVSKAPRARRARRGGQTAATAGRQTTAAAARPQLPTLRAAGVTAKQLVGLEDLEDYSSLSSSDEDDSSDDVNMKDTDVTGGPRITVPGGLVHQEPQAPLAGPASQGVPGPVGHVPGSNLLMTVGPHQHSRQGHPITGLHPGAYFNPVLGPAYHLASSLAPTPDLSTLPSIDQDIAAHIEDDLRHHGHIGHSSMPQAGSLGPAVGVNPNPHCFHRQVPIPQTRHHAPGPAGYPALPLGPLNRSLSVPMASAAAISSAAAPAMVGMNIHASPLSAPAAAAWQQQQQQQAFGHPGSQQPWGYQAGQHAVWQQQQQQQQPAAVHPQQLYAPNSDGSMLVPVRLKVVDGIITTIEQPGAEPVPATMGFTEQQYYQHQMMANSGQTPAAAAPGAAAVSQSGESLATGGGTLYVSAAPTAGMPRLPPIRTQVSADLGAAMPPAAAASGSSNSAAAQTAMEGGAMAAAAAAAAAAGGVSGRTTSAVANDMLHAGTTAATGTGLVNPPAVLRFDSHDVNNTEEAALQALHKATAATQQHTSEEQQQQQQQGSGSADAEKPEDQLNAQQQLEAAPVQDVGGIDVDMETGNIDDQQDRSIDLQDDQDHMPPKKRQKVAGEAAALAAAAILPTGPALELAAAAIPPPPQPAAAEIPPATASVPPPTGPAPLLAATAADGSAPALVSTKEGYTRSPSGAVNLEPAVLPDQARVIAAAAAAKCGGDIKKVNHEGVDAVAHILE